MRKAQIRVALDDLSPNMQKMSREKQEQVLRKNFKKVCDDFGLMHILKEHEFFVSKSEKRRRCKRRSAKVRSMGEQHTDDENRNQYQF